MVFMGLDCPEGQNFSIGSFVRRYRFCHLGQQHWAGACLVTWEPGEVLARDDDTFDASRSFELNPLSTSDPDVAAVNFFL